MLPAELHPHHALSSVELRQRKVEPRPGIAPGKCRFADDRVRLLAREAMVRRPGNAPGGSWCPTVLQTASALYRTIAAKVIAGVRFELTNGRL